MQLVFVVLYGASLCSILSGLTHSNLILCYKQIRFSIVMISATHNPTEHGKSFICMTHFVLELFHTFLSCSPSHPSKMPGFLEKDE